ncbi:MAG TPA: alpha/beta hydrolase [Chromatiales bacterium]|nr:alpha/beta hydrolase [Chromatiales bacterium]
MPSPIRDVEILLDDEPHEGLLGLPAHPLGLVLFAHGSGSSRLSPRNTQVARVLQSRGIATLMFDLLTEEEDRVYATRFDIALLSHRLLGATRWVRQQEETRDLPLGYFGASTGAAAALIAAATLCDEIRAVVSRGGRPDLAMQVLAEVTTPTLMLVGGLDFPVIEMNEAAYQQLGGPKELRIIPGATHLFEEPGTLEQVADAAAEWFARHLPAIMEG